MKRSFILALVLMTATIIGFSGCDNAIGPGAETAVLNNVRAAAVLNANGPGTLSEILGKPQLTKKIKAPGNGGGLFKYMRAYRQFS
jgi:hypothetical protein